MRTVVTGAASWSNKKVAIVRLPATNQSIIDSSLTRNGQFAKVRIHETSQQQLDDGTVMAANIQQMIAKLSRRIR